jgi:hypothetical protein
MDHVSNNMTEEERRTKADRGEDTSEIQLNCSIRRSMHTGTVPRRTDRGDASSVFSICEVQYTTNKDSFIPASLIFSKILFSHPERKSK